MSEFKVLISSTRIDLAQFREEVKEILNYRNDTRASMVISTRT
jgi:hypothetical protein